MYTNYDFPRPKEFTLAGNVEVFVGQYWGQFYYSETHGWVRSIGGIYESANTETIICALEVLECMKQDAFDYFTDNQTNEDAQAYAVHVNRTRNGDQVQAMLDWARPFFRIECVHVVESEVDLMVWNTLARYAPLMDSAEENRNKLRVNTLIELLHTMTATEQLVPHIQAFAAMAQFEFENC